MDIHWKVANQVETAAVANRTMSVTLHNGIVICSLTLLATSIICISNWATEQFTNTTYSTSLSMLVD